MKQFKFFMSLLVAVIVVTACEREDSEIKALSNYTVSQTVFGVFKNEEAVAAFDEDLHQLSFNQTLRRSRFQTDDQVQMLQMTLSEEPKAGANVTLSVYTRGFSGIGSSYDVQIVKTDEKADLVWMINTMSLMGFVMYYDF